MSQIINQKRSWRAEREFGLIVGGVLLLLSCWWMYRGKFHSLTQITAPVALLLMFLGIALPRLLVYPNKAWMGLAESLSWLSTLVILAFVYFIVITPIGVVKRGFGWDPLNRRAARSESYWRPYSDRHRNPRHYEKMF